MSLAEADAAGLAMIAETLAPQRTAGRLIQARERWILGNQ
jgi:hypothetical protein